MVGKLFWWSLIATGIAGSLVFVALLGLVLWAMLFGVPGQVRGQ